MNHRGACACDNDTGDGAGVLSAIPHDLYKKEWWVHLLQYQPRMSGACSANSRCNWCSLRYRSCQVSVITKSLCLHWKLHNGTSGIINSNWLCCQQSRLFICTVRLPPGCAPYNQCNRLLSVCVVVHNIFICVDELHWTGVTNMAHTNHYNNYNW